MAKFKLRVVQENDSWVAEIVRKKTVKEIIVTKKQDGFKTEKEANEWGEVELSRFVTDFNKRKHLEKYKG